MAIVWNYKVCLTCTHAFIIDLLVKSAPDPQPPLGGRMRNPWCRSHFTLLLATLRSQDPLLARRRDPWHGAAWLRAAPGLFWASGAGLEAPVAVPRPLPAPLVQLLEK